MNLLPNNARIKSSSDFARVTKSGRRVTTNSLIGYLYQSTSNEQPKLGLIVGKSIGNSVARHRVARQIRHAAKNFLTSLPNGSMFVVRAMKNPENAFTETEELMAKVLTKASA
jgi:ribonuclease P protein component